MNINNEKTGNVNIPGALHSTGGDGDGQIGGVVAYTGDIYDVTVGKNQKEINQTLLNGSADSNVIAVALNDLNEKVEEQEKVTSNALNDLNGKTDNLTKDVEDLERVTSSSLNDLDEKVDDIASTITAVDTRLATLEDVQITAEDVIYNSSEIYTNGTVGNAIQTGITASATSASAAASSASTASGYYSDILTAMGSLGSGEAVAAQVAINQADIAELKSDIVVDLSTRYSASYANLSAALTALNSDTATDATAVKKAGVSVKFINSTTNKYEQWNLKSSSWSINTSDWTLDIDGSIANGKLKLPFELTKPNAQTPVTNATEIKYGNKWLNAVLDEQKASLDSVEEAVLGEPVNETYTSADFCGLIHVSNAGGGTPATSETFTDSDYCGFFFSQAIAEYEDIIGTYNSSNLCGFFYSNSQGKFIAATSTYDGIYVPLVSGKKYKFNGSVKTFATEPANGATMSVETSINKGVAFTAGENDKYAFVTVTLASFSELTVKELRTPTASEGQFIPSSNVYNAIVFPLVSGKSYKCDADILTFASEPVASAFAGYTNSRSANTGFTASANENYGVIRATVASFSSATLITQGSGSTDPGFIAATSA